MSHLNKYFNLCYDNMKCNTSYPVYIEGFQQYQSKDDIFLNVDNISCYIHVPFCKSICSFCEYTKFVYDESFANHYLDLLEIEIESFFSSHSIKKIYGFDIGGGTPSALKAYQLERLLKMQSNVEKKFIVSDDFEKSIEITFSTIDEEKIELISRYGFNRVSAGIQSFDIPYIGSFNRTNPDLYTAIEINKCLKKYGIKKLNIDLMYGLPNQNIKIIDRTLMDVILLSPEQVTVYETRYNQNHMTCVVTRDEVYNQYDYIYNRLISSGYIAEYGSNTFSKCNDYGVSSYILHRMLNFVSYKGFGLSAQSMTLNGISYNVGKNCLVYNYQKHDKIFIQDNYLLPKEELLAKFFSIAMYSGFVSRKDLLMFNKNFFNQYYQEIEFLLFNNYIVLNDYGIRLTPAGFKYYGAICSLFWSKEQKKIFEGDK